MQFLMSPGGRTSKSRRRRPELPPSSVTVTTVVISRSILLSDGRLGKSDVLLQAVKQRRQAGATADSNDSKRTGEASVHGGHPSDLESHKDFSG